MRLSKTCALSASILTVVATQALHADALPIVPGMWETTTTMSSEMLGTKTNSHKECIDKTELDPDMMMDELPTDQCTVESKLTGNVLDYSISCEMEGGMMDGVGTITSEGDTMTGSMTLKTESQGVQMEMQMDSTGKRLGDC